MSLISQGDIKYEGILSHIDMAKSEICLTQGAGLSREKQTSRSAQLCTCKCSHHFLATQEGPDESTCSLPLLMLCSAIVWDRGSARSGIRGAQ